MGTKEKEIINYATKLSWYYIVLAILGFVIIMLPMFFYSNEKVSNAGAIGDAVGGILNPLIAVSATILTFLAFWVQYQANQEVQKQFKIQQFESQFYEMLRLHKENINEMRIVGYEPMVETSIQKDINDTIITKTETTTKIVRLTENRKVFITMITELIACYELLSLYSNKWNLDIKEEYLLNLAYKFFFFGSNSEIVSSEHIEKGIIDNFRIELNNVKQKHKDSIGDINRLEGRDGEIIKLYIKYLPFSGHENRLGHYYRHLYSTVKYVVNKEKEGLLNYKQSREYLKILRSQMSNDEQLMLYYNYIIGFGSDWENEGYLTKYRMLHNLPINKIKYVSPPREHFKDYISSIEQNELQKRDDLFEWGDYES